MKGRDVSKERRDESPPLIYYYTISIITIYIYSIITIIIITASGSNWDLRMRYPQPKRYEGYLRVIIAVH